MPKRSTVRSPAPGGKLPRAFRVRTRKPRPGGSRTAAETGRIGGATYWQTKEPKPRTGPNYTTIVIKDPRNPERARPFARGKRGGIYPQKKWDSTKSVLAALPAAAVLTTAVAYAGMRLKEQPTIAEWATWYPGGYTGMALTVGAAGAYVAYKNRHVLGLLVGLGIGFYALVKLALARLGGTDTSETPTLETSQESSEGVPVESASKTKVSAESSTPARSKEEIGPSTPLGKAITLVKAGNLDFQNGQFASAATNYNNAFVSFPDPLAKYNNGRALQRLGEEQQGSNPDAKSASGMALWASNKLSALRAYDTFISMEGKTSKMADLDTIKDLKAKAKAFRKAIFDELIQGGHIQEENPDVTPVEGSHESLIAGGNEDDYEVMIEGDDDEDISGDEDVLEIEGDDDDEDDISGEEIGEDDEDDISGDDEYEVVEGEADEYGDSYSD